MKKDILMKINRNRHLFERGEMIFEQAMETILFMIKELIDKLKDSN